MSTKEQTKANKKNAQKSTGPRTAEGKAVVSKNAVKHGLFAAEAVITGEDPADYELYHDQYLAELAPVGMVESTFAERIVSLAWRLRRAERMQNQSIEDMIERTVTNPKVRDRRERNCYDEGIRPGDPRFDPDHLALGRIATGDWSYYRVLDRMLLYERRIESSMTKMMKELKRVQIMRRIERQATEKHKPSPSLRDEAATRRPPAENEGDLKKQSQFIPAIMAVKSFVKGDYGNMPAGRIEENKANSNPNKANQSQLHESVLAKVAGKRKKSVAAVTG